MFQKNDRLVENFSLEYETGNFHSKIVKKNLNQFCFGGTVLLTSVVSGLATLGRGVGFEEFSLV